MAIIDSATIVVPVRNEAQALPSCIEGIRAAIAHAAREYPGVSVAVRFALDRCSDRSAEIIDSADFRWVESVQPGVGAARAAAVAAALGSLDCDPDRVLVACTDADSIVPADWLTHQIGLANHGADVIVGAVEPDSAELDSERRRAWEVTHRDGQARGHVHGANLGLRASVYLEAGGFEPVLEHEDVDLVGRSIALGARIQTTEVNRVVTSGRLEGRTPDGYAGYLRDQLLPLASSLLDEQSVA
jgi:glycosyltransferase involved in cell wall biosynthesis